MTRCIGYLLTLLLGFVLIVGLGKGAGLFVASAWEAMK